MKENAEGVELLVAFGTDDGAHLNEDHVGMAKYFHVYSLNGTKEEFVEQRENSKFKGDESMKHGDPQKARATATALDKIDVIVGKRFGPNLLRLRKNLVCVVVRVKRIDEALRIIQDHIEPILEEYNKGEDRKHLVLNTREAVSIERD
ncbi:hypothetical protein JW926_14425 [Candidatus Sumerlaeota bacterium]|nr:hypothetical protein [Candidatus Sumerlaeota bacterium]